MNNRRALLAACCLLIGTATAASATAAPEGPCAADTRRLCNGVKKGGGRIVGCLEAHRAELSDACRSHLTDWKPRSEGPLGPCAGDLDRFCGKSGGPRAKLHCLHMHSDSLSTGCQEALKKHDSAPGHKPKESDKTPPKDADQNKDADKEAPPATPI